MKKQLHENPKPKEQIEKFLLEFVYPFLLKLDFKYEKQNRAFVRINGDFEYRISWVPNKNNTGSKVVKFDLFRSVYCAKFRNWEKEFYILQQDRSKVPILSDRFYNIPNIDKSLYIGWYDLVQFDDKILVSNIIETLEQHCLAYFQQVQNSARVIEMLSQYPIRNFELIVDLFLYNEDFDAAHAFFFANNKWHEEQLELSKTNKTSQFALNRKELYLLRKSMILEY